MGFSGMILAAGKGTRMKSALPKVLHPLAGKPMLYYPIQALFDAGAERVVVVIGHDAGRVEEMLAYHFEDRVTTALQAEQRGTGDAVASGLQRLQGAQGALAIAYGDMPLLQASVFQTLSRSESPLPLRMLTTNLQAPTGYGRIIRNAANQVVEVKEQRDCNQQELAICEINPGVYFADLAFVREAVKQLRPSNAQRELLLTDIVKMAAQQGEVEAINWSSQDLRGVNDRRDLAMCEKLMHRRIAEQHAVAGVTIRDVDSVYIDRTVEIESDVTLENGVVLRGFCHIASGVHVDTGCVLTDMQVGKHAHLKPYTVASQGSIGTEAKIGPFAHLRQRTVVANRAQIGNFVETKNTHLGENSKANHLSYLGDGDIGDDVNIGAGTIFCNYDGVQKHRTVLENGVFVGSDSQLVAPVRVGKNAYVGTGTTVTMDVPDDALAIGRARQQNKPDYAKVLRKRLAAGRKKT